MTATRAFDAGDPRVSPALSSHLEQHVARQQQSSRLVRGSLGEQGGLAAALWGVRRLSDVVLDWPTRSHRRSLRNAMLASTVLVERRIERDDVESFLHDLEQRRSEAGTPGASQHP
ncbi:hypothetical protein KLP28_01585 [Nocardioidaceae bacterium]|nr:hypothetical protein KLP28_01585 [Nocardioidaceae bacterium]